jgi:hypothetical protein
MLIKELPDLQHQHGHLPREALHELIESKFLDGLQAGRAWSDKIRNMCEELVAKEAVWPRRTHADYSGRLV